MAVLRRRRERATRAALTRDLPELARAIARCCAAGLPLADALARAGDAVADEGAVLLREAAEAVRAGHSTHSALAPIGALPGGALLVGAIELHGEVGGDLVASLSAIAEGLADRERLRLEAHAATAQARVAAKFVPLAPVVSLGFLAILAPDALVSLVSTVPGLTILGVAGGLTGLALLILRQIAREVGL